MAKAKVKPKKKKVPTVTTGPIGPNVGTINPTIGSFIGTNSMPPAAKLAAAEKVRASAVPRAENVAQQLDVMEQQAEQENAERGVGLELGDTEVTQNGIKRVARAKVKRKAK